MAQCVNTQDVATDIHYPDSCQVVCFVIGPGGYYLLQYADNQHYQSFITRQVVRNFRNAASEHINIVKRRKPL